MFVFQDTMIYYTQKNERNMRYLANLILFLSLFEGLLYKKIEDEKVTEMNEGRASYTVIDIMEPLKNKC